jgi:hypothetical protein
VGYKNCPATWKKIKEDRKDERKRQALVKHLQTTMR